MRVDFRVYLITDRGQAPGGDILRAVEGALHGGVRAVQLREKDLPGKDLYLLAGKASQLVAWDQNHQFCGRCGNSRTWATRRS